MAEQVIRDVGVLGLLEIVDDLDDGVKKSVCASVVARSVALVLLLLPVPVSSRPLSRWVAVGQRKPSESPLCVSTRTGPSRAPAIAGSTRRRSHLPTPSWSALSQSFAPECAPPAHLEHQLGPLPAHKQAPCARHRPWRACTAYAVHCVHNSAHSDLRAEIM